MTTRLSASTGTALLSTGLLGTGLLGTGLLAIGLGISGCGTQAAAKPVSTVQAATEPLATSLGTAQGTWAIMVMGGSAADENNFWQVFVRPASSSRWSLVTPPGVADNGGLVAASGSASLTIGFRPSQDLAFSPLATSTDGGKAWAPGLLDAALADVPDALSISASGQELALLQNGTIESGTASGTWSRLATVQQLAASAPGHECDVTGVDAVSFWQNEPVAAVSCGRPGVAGVFLDSGGTWQAASPALPSVYTGERVQVLRLSGDAALLLAGSNLLATWRNGSAWSAPAVLPDVTGTPESGFGAGGSAWVLSGDGRAETIAGPDGTWQALPAPPDRTAVLAPDGAGYDALSVSGSVLTVWQLDAGSWTKAQVINVPIQYGSSS
jgi:hypothetical protein